MIDKYIIENAYPDSLNQLGEITIKSNNLLYSELGTSHSGCQSNEQGDNKIHKLCREVSKLIKEIDKLNNKP